MKLQKIRSLVYPLSISAVLFSSGADEKVNAAGNRDISDKKQLNVLFFFIDDLRPDLGCYGNSKAVTPNIDKLASTGIVFSRAFCQQAVCNPSRTSLLTGLRPDETGVTDLETHFRSIIPDVITLPQLFKNNGYLTLGAGKVFHSLPFIVDNPSWSRQVPGYEVRGYLLPENQVGTGKQNVFEAADVSDKAYPDAVIADTVVRYMEEAKIKNQAFFIAAGFTKPHAPFCAPKKYWDIFRNSVFEIADRSRPAGSPGLAFHNWEELRGYRDIPKEGPLTPEKEQELYQGYYACISYMDAQVGRVLEKLDNLDLRKNTIIIFWGDNGYHLGEQDTWCKATNFELDARIPLIIAAPGMKGNGTRCDAIVESLDIYPTLANLCGLTPQGRLSGRSLKSLLDNPAKKWKNIAYHQFIRPYSAILDGNPTHIGYSVRTEEWRCTYWWDLGKDTIVEKELYHLNRNGLETENLAGRPEYNRIESRLSFLVRNYKNRNYIIK